jgi:membrane peptidoglycan carboxypeptidase
MAAMNNESAPNRRAPALLARLLAAAALCGALTAGLALPFVGGLGLAANKVADRFLDTSCDLVIAPAGQTSTVLASDGKTVLATLFEQNRQDVSLSQVPKSVQQALISTEDRRFYSHHGVDLRGLARAAAHNGSDSSSTQGGSTLTMQYVKQVRYYQARTDAERAAAIEQNLKRKMQDAQCAISLEKKYSKSQILQNYLNIAFFGENSYGIETAARTYFGVSAAKLSLDQGALLVGLLRSPSALDPFVNLKAARERRDEVLANMVDNQVLGAAQAARYQARPVKLSSSEPPAVRQGCAYASAAVANAGFFCDYLVHWLETDGGMPRDSLKTAGLKIVTTLDAKLQNKGQRAIWASGLKPTSPTALVMPSVDPKTGSVQTMITSRHYGVGKGQTTLPLFTTGYAGSGSTYKYFTAITALKLGVQPDFTLTTGSNAYTVRNCPVDPNSDIPPYTTHNAGTYSATLPLSQALPESVNTYFVAVEDQLLGCNIAPIVQTALGLGMKTLNTPERPGSKTTIAQAVVGQHQAGFTLGFAPTAPLELTAAYAAAANDGVFCPPTPVLRITGPDGAPVKYAKPSCSRQFPAQVARTMVKMMTADTTSYQGTAAGYFQNWYAAGGSKVAAKTGTDNDDLNGPNHGNGNSALWFAGVTPHLTSAAALVNPQNPKATVAGLPEQVSNNGSDVFGAYASTFWLDAYGSTLQRQQWSWPDPSDVPDARQVPNLIGKEPADARTLLATDGFTASVASVPCGSGAPAGTVGYFGPRVASPGSVITLCLSNGHAPDGSYTGWYYNPGSGFSDGNSSQAQDNSSQGNSSQGDSGQPSTTPQPQTSQAPQPAPSATKTKATPQATKPASAKPGSAKPTNTRVPPRR